MILSVLDISIITCCLFLKYYLDCKYSQVIKVMIVFDKNHSPYFLSNK